jgi:hypothetical protein
MSRDAWFRNTSWNAEIEEVFFARLAHAGDKSQPLRIQAHTLASGHPQVALRLLDEYFVLGEHFDMAQAFVDRATAHLALRQVDAALLDYESALLREDTFPQVRTRAYLELPFLIAKERMSQLYDRAVAVLERHQTEPTFPLDRFCWNCAFALILFEQGDRGRAKETAQRALAAASETKSGLGFHPKVGLVESLDASLHRRLAELAA